MSRAAVSASDDLLVGLRFGSSDGRVLELMGLRLRSMPLEFLTDAQVARYGRLDGVPSRADLERFFVLDEVDRKLIGGRRGVTTDSG
ncbi:MAG: hypothetical protein DLM58_19690 [Pseudonocardiales bacterium]|nr:MAG: hypothetical protein DLM58_19690 [Pseudonocardiales bacterium]